MSLFPFPTHVNERAARLVAGTVAVLSAIAAVSGWPWLPWALSLGFLLRVAWGPAVSPLARLAVWLAAKLWAPLPVPGRPKRFAQGIGFFVTLTAGLLASSGQSTASAALMAMLVVFAVLESALGFCFGCWLFARLQARGWVAADACEVCVVPPRTAKVTETDAWRAEAS
jgi:hypothetical protein